MREKHLSAALMRYAMIHLPTRSIDNQMRTNSHTNDLYVLNLSWFITEPNRALMNWARMCDANTNESRERRKKNHIQNAINFKWFYILRWKHMDPSNEKKKN